MLSTFVPLIRAPVLEGDESAGESRRTHLRGTATSAIWKMTYRACITTEESIDVQIAVASDDWLQNRTSIIGAGDVTFTQQRPLQVAELIETEQRMIARAAEVAVVG